MKALLDAVIERPDDDALRLVLADAIEEDGDAPRAELVRLQCRLARLPAWCAEARDLTDHTRLLMAQHGRRWRASLPVIDGVQWGRFERGLPVEVKVDGLSTLAAHAERIRALAPVSEVEVVGRVAEVRDLDLPWVRTLRLVGREDLDEDVLAELLATRLCAGLSTLALVAKGIENAGARRIAAAELPRLEHLILPDCFIGQQGVEDLAVGEHSGLRTLNLSCTASGYVDDPFVNDAGIDAIVEGFGALEALHLTGNRVQDRGVRTLLESELPLRTLVVQWSDLTDAALDVAPGPVRLESLSLQGARLAEGTVAPPQLSALRRLDLSGTGVGQAFVRSLAKSGARDTLADLRLSTNPLGKASILAMGLGTWKQLHTLMLTGCGIDAEAAGALAARRFPVLRDLRLDRNAIGAGLRALAEARWWRTLRRVDLSSGHLQAADVAVAIEAAPDLVALDLSQSRIGDDGLRALARWEAPHLRELVVGNCAQAFVGEALAGARWLGRLVHLGLERTGLTDGDLELLLARPMPALRHLDIGANTGLGHGDLAARIGHLDLLRLEMANCLLPEDKMRDVVATPMFAGLTSMRVEGNRHDREAVRGRQFERAGPDLEPDRYADSW
ncbi:MAG: TIGR02996 domain-containing protein [Alphaproteobacteria bacterium]|nr:TIGR02996 domain-containing protein [Alphaproteobacteria bacterium]